MTTMPGLQTALLDLLYEVKGTDVVIIIGRGYGIYLKTGHVQRLGKRTLFQEWPEPRSTNDLDLFLRPELLIDAGKVKPLAQAITRLGYQAVPGAENYQFVKPGPGGGKAGSIKIDILTGPRTRFDGTTVKTDTRRARPNPSVGIHAHPVDETPTLEEGLLPEMLTGNISSGRPWQAEVYLPHPYTFAMMKLFAFRDRLGDADKEYGRYHALDLYTILATTTESEWREALAMHKRHAEDSYVKEAGNIVATYFAGLDSLGMIRMRESRYYRPQLQLADFMSTMNELFPIAG